MQSTTIDSLHVELIWRVCEYLDYTHPPSLLAFARVNKRCYAAARGLRFRTIKVRVAHGKQLVREVETWHTRLERENAFPHVRRLVLYWQMRRDRQSNDPMPAESAVHENAGRELIPYVGLHPCERHDDDSGLSSPWDLYDYNFPSELFGEAFIVHEHWKILAGLVEKFTGLADLFYAHPGQFPPCLLHLLHERVPRCRLHHYTFDLVTLDHESTDAHAMALASSPSLYSIGGPNLTNHRAVWNSVRSRATRLKEAHVWVAQDGVVEIDYQIYEGPAGPLEAFHLNDSDFVEGTSFYTVYWALSGDFSALRVLKLDELILDLVLLPPASDFPVLASLIFRCEATAGPEYWAKLLPFLHDLPSLSTLQLWDWDRSISAVAALNPNLKTLLLSTWTVEHIVNKPLLQDHIQQLAELCPLLEDLSLELRRSRGDVDEVSLYRHLGRLPRLQHLSLQLDASPPPLSRTVELLDEKGNSLGPGSTIEPWFDAASGDAKTLARLMPYRQGHFRDVLINSAIDSDLARSIFQAVDKAKALASASASVVPLEQLDVRVVHNTAFASSGAWRRSRPVDTFPFLNALGARQKWVVKRDIRDDARDLLHLTQGLVHNSPIQPTGPKDMLIGGSACLLPIWKRLWPSKRQGGSPLGAWKSWPLSEMKELASHA